MPPAATIHVDGHGYVETYGHAAYVAWQRHTRQWAPPWGALGADEQAAWEEAAQAVLADFSAQPAGAGDG